VAYRERVQDVPLIVVPDEDDDDFAELAVDGTIDARPYRFMLDTGAGRTHVVADDYTRSLAAVGRHTASGVFSPIDDEVVRLGEVAVGPLQRGPLDASRGGDDRPDGHNLLGMDVLRHYRCLFRFAHQRLEVDPTQEPAVTLPLHLDDAGHPYVEVGFPGVDAHAVWDTGAGVTVVDAGFLARHRELFHERAPTRGSDATGTEQQTPMHEVVESVIGGVRFAPHTVAAVDLAAVNATLERPMDVILGWTTLRQADWFFDFPGRRWAVVA
jgi:predicted aspartyl protease